MRWMRWEQGTLHLKPQTRLWRLPVGPPTPQPVLPQRDRAAENTLRLLRHSSRVSFRRALMTCEGLLRSGLCLSGALR